MSGDRGGKISLPPDSRTRWNQIESDHRCEYWRRLLEAPDLWIRISRSVRFLDGQHYLPR